MQFMGFDGFIWFTGVVEERNDPMKLGRVKVRIAGLHTENKTQGIDKGIPTADLPWAYPMQPITSAAMNGIGESPIGVVEGTWVVGFFRDGKNCQEPIVMGTLGGFPMETPGVSGFNDPNMVYPKATHLIEPDTHRRAVIEFEEPIENAPIDSKPTDLDTKGGRIEDEDVTVALSASTWSEPPNPFAAVYPFNHVRASESGHVEEWDDTLDNERLMRWHKAGTFEEIRADGTKVTKVVKDNYHITMGDDYIHITPDAEGNGGNCYVTVDGNAYLKVDGNYNVQVGGNYNIEVMGNWNVDILGNTNISTVGTKDDESAGIHTIKGAVIHLNP